MKKTVIFLVIHFVLYNQAFCQEVGNIISAQGRVDIFKSGSSTAIPASENDTISVGDSIRTKSGSKAHVVFKDKSVLKLAQNSKVMVKDYQLDGKNIRKAAAVELSRGKARAIVAKALPGSDFFISTPNARGSVRGSDVTAFYQAGTSGMFVTEGKLSVQSISHPEANVLVNKGNVCLIPSDGFPKDPRPYMEVEKKINDEDTEVPISIDRTGKVSAIKGMVAKVSGAVNIVAKGAGKASKATVNTVIGEGDLIETKENGYIEIRFDNNNAINLKPNTKLSITKLIINPETGEFENVFDVTIGGVRARIEGLKGNSKFEVKTPTALCGARGTIMYVYVGSGHTKAFFEGGNGYIEELLNGVRKDVLAGQNASADDRGGVSNSGYTSDNERQSYSDGWDPSSGTESYSSPEANAGDQYGSGAGSLDNLINGAGDTGMDDPVENTGDIPPSNVPFTEVVDTNKPVTASVTSIDGSFQEDEEDDFGYYYGNDEGGMFVRDSGSMSNVNIYGEREVSGATAAFVVLGNYSDSKDNRMWDAGTLTGKTSDGASIFGWSCGIKTGQILKGLLYAFYVTADYRVSFIKSSDISGVFHPEGGVFSGQGNILYSQIDHATVYGPDQIYAGSDVFVTGDIMNGAITGDSFKGTFNSDSIEIKDQEWGLWKSVGGGEYEDIPDLSWNARTGGRMINPETGRITGYAAGDIFGEAWQDDQFSAILYGYWLSEDNYGSFQGDIIGTFSDGRWQMFGLGLSENKEGFLLDVLNGRAASGRFDIPRGGRINAASLTARLLDIPGSDRGLYYLAASGNYTTRTSNDWEILNLTGSTGESQDYAGGSWLGGITGKKWSGKKISGELDAVWIALCRDGTLCGRIMNGEVTGAYTEVAGGGKWEAAGAGEWIEADNILDATNLTSLDAAVQNLGLMTNIPITVAHSSVMSLSSPVNGIQSLTMNTSLYNMPGGMDGIWAAIINGTYSTPPTGNWNVTVANGADNATLSGPAWSGDGRWIADNVSGTVGGSAITGQAAGTYGNGSFSGAGTGTFTQLPPNANQ